MNPRAGWQQVVLFEARDGTQAAVNDFVRQIFPNDETKAFRIERAARSPAGCQWYDGYIDFSIGERRALALASQLVVELDRAALPDYRLVAGREWLSLAVSQTIPG
ncbi:MAG TPA: hypothetical protein VFS55_09625 [Dokdonella sp.]|nr:hypothetical protein [Dokdonella sp.]